MRARDFPYVRMNNRGGTRGGGRTPNSRNQRGSGRGPANRGSTRPAIFAEDAATQPKRRLYPPGSTLYPNWFQVKEHWKAQSHSQRVWMLDTLKTKKLDQLRQLPMEQDTIDRGNIRLAVKASSEYRQGDKQSLIEYKRGFDLRWQQSVAIGAPEREAEYLCSAFIRGLHPLFSSLGIFAMQFGELI